jgi:hypothetical protein
MADMIDAKDAKQILGCDDATLNGHINKGQIRAQRVGGKLMLNKDDVDKLSAGSAAAGDDDDGTIVLTGDSENLQIDLGKVVDDTSETIVQSAKPAAASNTESITFGDELEVVNFDDGRTQDLQVEDKQPAKPSLSFTDSNTAVITSVDETQVGGNTTGVGMTAELDSPNMAGGAGESARRSVRSNRAKAEVEKVPLWILIILILTFAAGSLLGVPYYFMSMAPHDLDKDAGGNVLRGSADNGWSGMASGAAGFTVEPNRRKFQEANANAEWRDITEAGHEDPNKVYWRTEKYLGSFTQPGERVKTFNVLKVDGDQAITEKGGPYRITSVPRQGATNGETDDRVDLWGAGASAAPTAPPAAPPATTETPAAPPAAN